MYPYIIIGILAVIVVILSVRIFQYKRQMRKFILGITRRKSRDWRQPVTVDYFDKDILKFAEMLNEYTDMQKELEIQYENDRRQLKTVIAGISHDFRTPLTSAKGYLQLIEKSKKLSQKEKEYLDIAIEKVTYLKVLSDDFFEISTLEAKEEGMEISPLNITNFLSESILQQYGWMKQQGIRADFQLPETDMFIETNEHYLKRIIENLFSNVRKYVKSYVRMQVYFEKEQFVIGIENDVEGIEELDTDKVFEPFYRNPARSSEGSGLGLYVVACLAKKLGIEVHAACTGGVFRMELKIKEGLCRMTQKEPMP